MLCEVSNLAEDMGDSDSDSDDSLIAEEDSESYE